QSSFYPTVPLQLYRMTGSLRACAYSIPPTVTIWTPRNINEGCRILPSSRNLMDLGGGTQMGNENHLTVRRIHINEGCKGTHRNRFKLRCNEQMSCPSERTA